jgi:hypothetical protein
VPGGVALLVAVLGLAGCATPATLVPAQGQTAEEQAADRAVCEAEARDEAARTDPRRSGAYVVIPFGASPFDRAFTACMQRRGYRAE